ncbi:putative pentatricopeptide repeat-containing protein [Drosera capensis]
MHSAVGTHVFPYMAEKKLFFLPSLRTIPSTFLKSLRLSHNSATQLKPPFIPQTPIALSTSVIKSYCETGLVKDARKLFDEMPERDVVVWTAMITGYTNCNHGVSAWVLFSEMLSEEIRPNAFTVSSVLKACSGMRAYWGRRMVDGLAVKRWLVGVFEEVLAKNVATWTTMIAGYTHQGDGYDALTVFRRMISEEAELSPFSVSISVRACASTGAASLGRQIHAITVKNSLDSSIPVMNSMIGMYCRCDCIPEASRCFIEMTEKDLITWNALIAGYVRSNSAECLHILSKIESEGFSPNGFTFTTVVAACANLALLSCGRPLHSRIASRGLMADIPLSNTLVDMYVKCGSIVDSKNIFSEMRYWNIVSWTPMIIGHATHGHGKEAIKLFEQMISTGINPDEIVFMAVLNACSHAGLVGEGLKYFESMASKYNVIPDKEIYGCVVDMLGCGGRVKEAYELINNMPFEPDDYILRVSIGACKTHKYPSLGKIVTQRLSGVRSSMSRTYWMLSNMYAADGRWEESAKMRKWVKRLGNEDEAGSSWLELNNEVRRSVVGDMGGSLEGWDNKILHVIIRHMKAERHKPYLESLLGDF